MDNIPSNEQSELIIRKSVYWAMGAGVVPIPIGDLIAVTAVQLDMLKQLSNHLGVDYTEIRAKSFIAALSGSILPRIGASMLKALPGIGPLIGGASMAILSGASTYALGQVFSQYIDSNGSIDDIDMEEAKEKYEEELHKGKNFAAEIDRKGKHKKKNRKTSSDDNPYEKLEKLGKLKEMGIISEEEFQEKKQKLMDKI